MRSTWRNSSTVVSSWLSTCRTAAPSAQDLSSLCFLFSLSPCRLSLTLPLQQGDQMLSKAGSKPTCLFTHAYSKVAFALANRQPSKARRNSSEEVSCNNEHAMVNLTIAIALPVNRKSSESQKRPQSLLHSPAGMANCNMIYSVICYLACRHCYMLPRLPVVKLTRSTCNLLVNNRQVPDEGLLAPAKPCLESPGPVAYCCLQTLSKRLPVVIFIWPTKVVWPHAILHLVLIPQHSVSSMTNLKASHTEESSCSELIN